MELTPGSEYIDICENELLVLEEISNTSILLKNTLSTLYTQALSADLNSQLQELDVIIKSVKSFFDNVEIKRQHIKKCIDEYYYPPY